MSMSAVYKGVLKRKDYQDYIRALRPREGKIMENDNNELPTVELVSSETSGYVGADGKFVYGEPPVKQTETFVQTDEDVIAD